jgi:hypothetical protein
LSFQPGKRAISVSQRKWRKTASGYTIAWGGHLWTLLVDAELPGLRPANPLHSSILALQGVAVPGRTDHRALSGETLAKVELVRSRIEATYTPADWGGLCVRASWSPTLEGQGIDLEIQVSASSVGEIKAVEVFVASRFFDPSDPAKTAGALWVQARDARSAALCYDGREPANELSRLTVLPIPEKPAPEATLTISPWREAPGYYLEMAHPQDVARRVTMGRGALPPSPGFNLGVRYGLFGHDLEKGVILRGRLRGTWLPSGTTAESCRSLLEEFHAMPPPLGT